MLKSGGSLQILQVLVKIEWRPLMRYLAALMPLSSLCIFNYKLGGMYNSNSMVDISNFHVYDLKKSTTKMSLSRNRRATLYLILSWKPMPEDSLPVRDYYL